MHVLQVIALDSFKLSFKLFLHAVDLRVRTGVIAIRLTRFYSYFGYEDESSRILTNMLSD
jgi:hypothetical protein